MTQASCPQDALPGKGIMLRLAGSFSETRKDTMDGREHLFISYATEDSDLAEWLAVRLAAEGYRVWCDRTHLLGGESYPADIDRAIKDHTFRLLALLSRASLGKPNPRKERTLALNIARERGIDFLIPLNVDGLSATELDWMTSDLTFIPFHSNWAAGFGQLIKKLNSIDAPRDVGKGRRSVCDWMAVRADATQREEILRANVLPVIEAPQVLHKYELQQGKRPSDLHGRWPCYALTKTNIAWSFAPPDADLGVSVVKAASVSWQDVPEFDGLRMADVGQAVLRKALTVKCLQRGMRFVPKSRLTYFPAGILPDNRLRFTSYDGKSTFVNAVGERTFKSGEIRERIRYHLAPGFWLSTSELGQRVVRVAIHLHLTDLRGTPLEGAKVTSRRKRICRSWWNHEWLCRFMGVVEWLAEGKTECEIWETPSGAFTVASAPITLSAGLGIDESTLKPAPEDVEAVELDEDEDIGRDDSADADDGDEGAGDE